MREKIVVDTGSCDERKLFQKFENEFQYQVSQLGFEVISLCTSHCFDDAWISYEIFRSQDEKYYNRKYIKIPAQTSGTGGWGHNPKLFLRLEFLI